jgi:hypothetical protein
MGWPSCTVYTVVRKPAAKGPLGDRELGKGNNSRMDGKATELVTSSSKRRHKPSSSVKRGKILDSFQEY